MMKNALILCSGGLDSVTTAHYVKKTLCYENLILLFLDYGQRNLNPERKCSMKCAEDIKAEFFEIKLPYLRDISTSLLNSLENVEEVKDLKNTSEENKKWYVPSRNLIFLSNAISLAESLFIKENKKYDVFVGFKNEGSEGFPDASPEFVEKINSLSSISTEAKPKILAPMIEKDKEDIIKLGEELNVNFNNTFSCYAGKEKHCGRCLACKLRQKGFYWANIKDTTYYKWQKNP